MRLRWLAGVIELKRDLVQIYPRAIVLGSRILQGQVVFSRAQKSFGYKDPTATRPTLDLDAPHTIAIDQKIHLAGFRGLRFRRSGKNP